jgi:MoxR-like ATPase
VAPTADAQATTQELLADLMASARNSSLPFAAEALARGASARAARLVEVGRGLLADGHPRSDGTDGALRIEATLREIDACFAVADLPSDLAEVRTRLVDSIRA